MKRIKLKIILALLFAYSFADCQDSISVVNFRVLDAVTESPVELVHIVNITQGKASISDLLGYFKIALNIGDTITLSSLGYFNQVLVSWGQFRNDSIYYTINLRPRSYELQELKFSWFSNYNQFLKGFLQLQLPVTKEEKDIARIGNYFRKTIRDLDLKNLPQSSSGAGFGKDWLAKQNELLKEKLEAERERRLIERKYSAGIVEALTGLTGYEVFWFMEYCNFKDEFIKKVSDYEIRLRIIDKFKIYNQDKALKENK